MNVRDIFGVALLVAFLQVAGNLAGDPGVGWHLRAGEWILSQGSAPVNDMLLFGPETRPWIHDQWLSDLIFWELYRLGGLTLLKTVLVGMLTFSFVGLLGAELARESRYGLLTLGVLSLVAPLVTLQWFVRPLAFSFVLFTVVYRILLSEMRREEVNHSGWALPRILLVAAVFVLWANLHGGFVMGVLLLGAGCFASLFQAPRRYFFRSVLCLGLAVIGTLLTPYGIGLYGSITRLLGNSFFMQLNSEWQSPNFADALFLPLLFIVGVLFFATFRGRRFYSAFDVVLLLGFGALAVFERRGIPYFGIIAALPLLRILEQSLFRRESKSRVLHLLKILPERSQSWFLPATALVFLLLLIRIPFSPGEALPELPDGLTRLAGEGGRILHSPDMGGLIAWHQLPGLRPSLDDRNQVSPQEAYEEYFDIVLARKDWETKLEKYSGIILQKNDPLRLLLPNSNWQKSGEAGDLLLFRRVAPKV